jgi:hypothetical protein
MFHDHYCRCFVLALTFVAMTGSSGCLKPDYPDMPPGVFELYVSILPTDKTLFSTWYYILPHGPLQNYKPEDGVSFTEHLSFNGSVTPLAVTNTGELRFPLRVFVTPMPLGPYEITEWKPGDHVDISPSELYMYRLREDETGLCFAVLVERTSAVHMFPGDMKPLNIEALPEKHFDDLERSVKMLEIPDPSTLPLAPKKVTDMLERYHQGVWGTIEIIQ